MTTNPQYKLRSLASERLMVLDAPDGTANMTVMLKFNSAAAMLWEIAERGPFTAETLTAALRDHFAGSDATPDRIQHDVDDLLATWKKYNLIFE